MSCTCSRPCPSPDPRKTSCSRCALPIGTEGISTDASVKEFFDRLEAGMFSPKAKDEFKRWFTQLRQLTEERELEGREKFGLRYLDEGYFLENMPEEVADILCYSYLEHLRTIRVMGEDRDIDVLLQGLKQVSEGLKTLRSYGAKVKGSP